MARNKITDKYRLTDEVQQIGNHILYRIEALKDFGDVKKGDLGGFIEYTRQLSAEGDCWVYDDACVFNGYTGLSGDARVKGVSRVENSTLTDNALVEGHSNVSDSSMSGNSHIVDTRCDEVTMSDDSFLHSARPIVRSTLSEKAKVLGRGEVSDSQLSGSSRVDSFASVSNSAIGGNARISGRAVVDSSRVGDDVVVKGTTIVQPGSRLSGDKVIETGEITPKNDGHEKPQPEPGNKYILHPLDKAHWFDDVPLFQIEAVCDFGDIPKGSLGGYVHSEKNLSHEGFSWIEDGACVLNDAVVKDDAKVVRGGWVDDHAVVSDSAIVMTGGVVSGHAQVSGAARIGFEGRSGVRSIVDGHAQVTDQSVITMGACVTDHAVISGPSRLDGDVSVSGTARVDASTLTDCAVVEDDAQVIMSKLEDHAHVSENAEVKFSTLSDLCHVTDHTTVTDSTVSGDALIAGSANVVHSTVTGRALIDSNANVAFSTVKDGAYVSDDAKVSHSTVEENQSVVNVHILNDEATVVESDIDFSFLSQTNGLEH